MSCVALHCQLKKRGGGDAPGEAWEPWEGELVVPDIV